MPILSQRAYAKHRGVTHKAVQKAIATGRITTTPDGKIDSAVADAQWDRNRQHVKIDVVERAQQQTPASTPRREPSPERPRPDERDAGAASVPGVGGLDYAKARAIREQYNARLAKIEYEEKIGKLINRDEISVAAFNKSRVIRDKFLTAPSRLAPVLAAETDQQKVYEILDEEIRKILSELADALTISG